MDSILAHLIRDFNTRLIPDTPEPPQGGRPLPLPTGIDSPSGGAYNETTGQAAKPLPKANVPETVEVADWAKGHLVDRPSPAASRAASLAKQYVPDVFVVEDAAIKGRNSEAWAITSNGKVYISDAVPAYLADAVGYHEVVHCLKHRREPRYMEFLDEIGTYLNNQAEATDKLLKIVKKGRSINQDFIELNDDQRKNVCDEINAIVWGYYKDDPENARAQFAQMFRDYDAYIQKLDAIVEASRSG